MSGSSWWDSVEAERLASRLVCDDLPPVEKWPQRVFVEDTQGLHSGSRVSIKGELYDVLDVQPIDNSITLQPVQAKQQQETQPMKNINLLAALGAALGGSSDIVAETPRRAGETGILQRVLNWCSPPADTKENSFRVGRYGRKHSTRNKVGSHKQTMRKLGKL